MRNKHLAASSMTYFAVTFNLTITGAVLASSFILSNSMPMYLSIYVCMSARSTRVAKLSAAAD